MLNSLRKLPPAEASADSIFPPPIPPLGYPSETNDIRAALHPAHPPLPRPAERRDTCQDLRLFCEPFADFLYGTVPNRRRSGQIPRSVLRPLWRLLHQEHRQGPVGLTEVINLIQRAERDPSFAEKAASRHPDFWNIVDDIRAALMLEDRFRDTRDHLRAAAVAGCCPHWLLDHLAAAVAGLSAADPKAADLFVMLVARHRPVARTALEMLGRLADHPATRSHVAGLIDRLAEDVRSRATAAVPDRGPADPSALEAAVRDLLALKLTAGRLPQATLPFARLEADVISLLTGRFLPEVVERVLWLTPTDPTDLRRPDTRHLAAALACLARSRRMFRALGMMPDYEKALIALTGAVSRRLGDLATIAAYLPPEERRTALTTLGETLGVLHLIAPPSRLRPVRDHIEDLAGAA
jgi:hypothetical protein